MDGRMESNALKEAAVAKCEPVACGTIMQQNVASGSDRNLSDLLKHSEWRLTVACDGTRNAH
eukprot:m.126176 g.126176  ORF g.126176 m.126176 type:complete len:62 (+) comp13820_c0_seq1:111-296(+)